MTSGRETGRRAIRAPGPTRIQLDPGRGRARIYEQHFHFTEATEKERAPLVVERTDESDIAIAE